jgi:uncharacterized protein YegL
MSVTLNFTGSLLVLSVLMAGACSATNFAGSDGKKPYSKNNVDSQDYADKEAGGENPSNHNMNGEADTGGAGGGAGGGTPGDNKNGVSGTQPGSAPNSPAELGDPCNKPLAVSLVMDVSGSMTNDKMRAVQQAATQLLNSLDEKDLSGLVFFSREAQTVKALGSNHGDVASAIILNGVKGLGTNITSGMQAGAQQFSVHAAAADRYRVLILLSDGEHNVGVGPEQFTANLKATSKVRVITVISSRATILGKLDTGKGSKLMQGLATQPTDCKQASDDQLNGIFGEIKKELCR